MLPGYLEDERIVQKVSKSKDENRYAKPNGKMLRQHELPQKPEMRYAAPEELD